MSTDILLEEHCEATAALPLILSPGVLMQLAQIPGGVVVLRERCPPHKNLHEEDYARIQSHLLRLVNLGAVRAVLVLQTALASLQEHILLVMWRTLLWMCCIPLPSYTRESLPEV